MVLLIEEYMLESIAGLFKIENAFISFVASIGIIALIPYPMFKVRNSPKYGPNAGNIFHYIFGPFLYQKKVPKKIFVVKILILFCTVFTIIFLISAVLESLNQPLDMYGYKHY